MNASRKSAFLVTLILLLLSGCNQTSTQAVNEDQNAGLPNPASVYCEEQGGTLEIRTNADGSQVGVCIFDNGSECDEWAYFRDECQPGDSIDAQPVGDDFESTAEAVEMAKARQTIVEYLIEQYDIEITYEWEYLNDGQDDSPTRRFISNPWLIALTPMEGSDESPSYTVEMGGTYGFRWQGIIDASGAIQETSYQPPATISSPDEARDAVVASLVETYDLAAPDEWVVELPEPEDPEIGLVVYTAGTWTVEVRSTLSAPIVANYELVIDDTSASLHWEGEITSQGEITELLVTQE